MQLAAAPGPRREGQTERGPKNEMGSSGEEKEAPPRSGAPRAGAQGLVGLHAPDATTLAPGPNAVCRVPRKTGRPVTHNDTGAAAGSQGGAAGRSRHQRGQTARECHALAEKQGPLKPPPYPPPPSSPPPQPAGQREKECIVSRLPRTLKTADCVSYNIPAMCYNKHM